MMNFIFIVLIGAGLALAKDEDAFPLDKFDGQNALLSFPNFSREDIPRLLKVANSTEAVTECPANPISSRHIEKCLKGTVALWVIEGIRLGKYPSLNPVLYDKKASNKSETKLLDEAKKKYQSWWASGGKSDPFKDSSLSWY